MTDDAPPKLDGDFWFALFMLVASLIGTYLGFVHANSNMASVGVLFGALYLWRSIWHFKRYRLACGLHKNPELKRIYDARNK